MLENLPHASTLARSTIHGRLDAVARALERANGGFAPLISGGSLFSKCHTLLETQQRSQLVLRIAGSWLSLIVIWSLSPTSSEAPLCNRVLASKNSKP